MSLDRRRVIGPLSGGVWVAAVEQTLRVVAVIIVGGFASYLAVKYLAFKGVASRGPLVISHVTAATFAIGIGGVQFLQELRSRRPQWHRRVGRIYVGASLFAGLSALAIATRLDGLDAGALGLMMTALLWVATTTAGLWAICGRFVAAHRRWMIRSYGLALTAVTLRLYARGLAGLGIEDSGMGHAIVTWAPLISNLAVAEWVARTFPLKMTVHLRAKSRVQEI